MVMDCETLTVDDVVPVQPLASVPVTENAVVLMGATIIDEPPEASLHE